MTCNVGMADRLIRVLIGLVLISLVFVGPQTPFGWISVIPLVTAAAGWCPLYRIFGISSCGTRSA